MNSVVKHLRSFNRKERFYLVGMALGNEDFVLPTTFREKLKTAFDPELPEIPEDAFVAMDYHLDWIYASLFLSSNESEVPPYPWTDAILKANQEDVDLLVAFNHGTTTHLVFLEAKGVISFTNDQMRSKASRLQMMFEESYVTRLNVVPHFAIVSPYEPNRLETSSYPAWMLRNQKLRWIKMEVLANKIEAGALRKVTRCAEDKEPSQTGKYWFDQLVKP